MTGDDDYLEIDYYESEDEPRSNRRKWIGGTLAIIIIAGFGIGIWYAYDQGVKKGVQLAPPIISADTSPVKEEPVEPGGMDIPNQDKQVFSVLKSGETPEKVEKLMPPPEDATPEEKTAETAMSDAEKAADESKLDTLIEKATKDEPVAEAKSEAATETAPVADEKPAADEKTVEKAVEKAEEKIDETVEEKKVEVAAAPVPKKVEAPAPSGGPVYRVQVGSFRSQDAAEKQYSTLSSRFKSLLSGLTYRVEDVVVKDKGTYFRLQLGSYGDRDSAKQLCNDLKAQKQDCLVVSG